MKIIKTQIYKKAIFLNTYPSVDSVPHNMKEDEEYQENIKVKKDDKKKKKIPQLDINVDDLKLQDFNR